jgi:FG-GAP-like repeat
MAIWKTRTDVARAAALCFVACAMTGCESFVEIELGVCGNGVRDQGEDCDGFPHPSAGTPCAKAGEANACRFACDRSCEAGGCGDYLACPVGWGCGVDGICRQPSGTFAPKFSLTGFVAGPWMTATDFNGDGYDDLAVLEFTSLRARFMSGRDAPGVTFTLPIGPLGYPDVADVDADGRPDIVVPVVEGLAVLRGSAQPRLIPSIYPSFEVPPTDYVLVNVDLLPTVGGELPGAGDDLLAYTTGVFINPSVERLFTSFTVTAPDVTRLVGPLAAGQLDESTYAQEVVGGLAGEPFVTVFAFDTSPLPDGSPLISSKSIVLQSGEILTPPQLLDPPIEPDPADPQLTSSWVLHANPVFDGGSGDSAYCCDPGCTMRAPGDAHLDVAIASTQGLAIAFGLGDGSFHSDPCEVGMVAADDEAGVTNPMPPFLSIGCAPLAVADLDGDGLLDLVADGGVHLTSLLPPDTPLCMVEQSLVHTPFSNWTEAQLGDMNADGHLDVVALNASRGDIDVLLGSSSTSLTLVVVPQVPLSRLLRIGDFDGDGASDAVMLSSAGLLAPNNEELRVLWGEPFAVPEDVQSLGTVPEVDDIAVTSQRALGDASVDVVDDIGIITREYAVTADGTPDLDDVTVKYGDLFGRPDRQIMLPFRPAKDDQNGPGAFYLPTAVAAGQYAFASGPQALATVVLNVLEEAPVPELLGVDLAQPGTTAAPVGRTVPVEAGDAAELGGSDESRYLIGSANLTDVGHDQPLIFQFVDQFFGTRVHAPRYAGSSWETPAMVELPDALPAGAVVPIQDPLFDFALLSPLLHNKPVTCRLGDPEGEHIGLVMFEDEPAEFIQLAEDFFLEVDARSVAYLFSPSAIAAIRDGGASVQPLVVVPTQGVTAGLACGDIDGDGHDELVITSLLILAGDLAIGTPLDSGGAAIGFRITLEVADYDPETGSLTPLRTLAEFGQSEIGELASGEFDGVPAQGMVDGDFDGDGVVDFAFGAFDNTLILYGEAVNP